MQLEQQLNTRLEQNMSQAQIQSLDILAMSPDLLYERIIEEVTQNPALEIVPAGVYKQPSTDTVHEKTAVYSSCIYSKTRIVDGNDMQAFLENIPQQEVLSLQSVLLEQLHVIKIPPEVVRYAERIIQNLDTNGFHTLPISELFSKELLHSSDMQQVQRVRKKLRKALSVIRKLEPIGCAVNNFKDSLCVQAILLFQEKAQKEPVYAYTLDILHHHFSYLEKARPYSLKHAVNSDKRIPYTITNELAGQILSLVSTLDPFPGRKYAISDNDLYIQPIAFIDYINDELSVRINSSYLPGLTISSSLAKIAEVSSNPDEKAYIHAHIQQAKIFIGSLSQREKTIVLVLQHLIDVQKEFFITGDKKTIVPLLQWELASALGIHESTVSRTVSSKYIQCRWGIIALKSFFSRALSIKQSKKNDIYSKEGIKALIKEMIDTSMQKISDQKITDILYQRHGITLARRTVGKYRKELSIAPSYAR